MAKAFIIFGFVKTVETSPGVHKFETSERGYFCDITKNYRRFDSPNQVIDNLVVNNQFSFIADDFATKEHGYLKYLYYAGTKWEIETIDISSPPRIYITTGGIFNG